MKYTYAQALGWLALYSILALLPLAVVFVGTAPPARSFWVELGVGLGFVGLAMMGLQFVLTGRFESFASGMGLDNMLQFHRQAGMVAIGFIIAHPVVLIAAEPAYAVFFDPTVNAPRAVALTVVSISVLAIAATTLWRQSFGIPYEWWRAAHGGLAFLIVLIGLGHVLMVGYYVDTLWKQLVWIGFTGGALALLIYGRLIRPWLLSKRPWVVDDVRPEKGSSWTVRLRPEEHDGLDFEAGQFCWLTVGPTPFTLQQHPFTVASSAECPDGIEFTIKELGDFTATIGDIPSGTSAFVEGPFGAFTLDESTADDGAVFLSAGVGITPVMSMLRTLRDRGDMPPFQLIYGNRSVDDAIFFDRINDMARKLPLEVVHVLEEPPDDWDGHRGMITAGLLDEVLWNDDGRRQYYVCGPGPMMDVVEEYLVDRGIDGRRIFSERFAIV